jgi:hypothetical protein
VLRPAGARRFGWIGLAMAFAVAALFLLPGGYAIAYPTTLAGGYLRVGMVPHAFALLFALWAAWRWRPRGADQTAVGWCSRVACALLAAVCALPLVVLLFESDIARIEPDGRVPGRGWRFAAVVGGTLLLPLVWPQAATAIAFGSAAVTGRGPWRWWLALAAAAALAPPYPA